MPAGVLGRNSRRLGKCSTIQLQSQPYLQVIKMRAFSTRL